MSLTLPLPPLCFPTDASIPHLPLSSLPFPGAAPLPCARQLPPSAPTPGSSLPPRRRPAADLSLRTDARQLPHPVSLSLLSVLSPSAKKARHNDAAMAVRGSEAVAVARGAGLKRRVSGARSSTASRRLRMRPPRDCTPPPSSSNRAGVTAAGGPPPRRRRSKQGRGSCSNRAPVSRPRARSAAEELLAPAASSSSLLQRPGRESPAVLLPASRSPKAAPRARLQLSLSLSDVEQRRCPYPPLCFRRRESASEGWREALDAWAPR
jgi:hypothetical protein